MEPAPTDDPRWAQVEAMRDARPVRNRLAIANCAGALVVAIVGVAAGAPEDQGTISTDARNLISGLSAMAYIAVAVVVASRFADRRAARVFGWVDEHRQPTLAERRAVLRVPWAEAIRVFGWWLGAAVLYLVVNLLYGVSLSYSGRFAVDIALGGVASSVLTYLVLERHNRPVFSIVLEAEEVQGGGLDLRRRFVLIWLLSAAVPLIVMATAPVGLSAGDRADLLGPLVVLLILGLASGGVLTVLLARSVTDPLTALRVAQSAVRSGDLDAEVPVDDGGEVGVLQAEFNRMVEGLRERERLQDLFGRHVGDEVAREALGRGISLGGERRSASVLFVDITGSTGMAQRLAPEAVVEVLNDVFGAVVRCVKEEGGWVNKFEGDAALCVFGPPGDDPGHAAAALRAARALRAELVKLAKRHRGLDAGIGVSSGEVVAGNIGAEDRYEYTVIGDPVNEAARLTEHAKSEAARVLASGAAVAAANGDGVGEWKRLGKKRLRGRAASTELFTPA